MNNILIRNPRRSVFLASLSIVLIMIFLSFSNMTAFSDDHRYQIKRSSLHSYGGSLACDKEKNVGYTLNATAGQAEAGNRLGTKVLALDGGFGSNRAGHGSDDCPAGPVGVTTIFLPLVTR